MRRAFSLFSPPVAVQLLDLALQLQRELLLVLMLERVAPLAEDVVRVADAPRLALRAAALRVVRARRRTRAVLDASQRAPRVGKEALAGLGAQLA